MRTEDDIRAAFRALAHQAPDADAVLTAVRDQLDKASAVQLQDRQRGVRRPLAAVASAVAVLAVIGGSIALAVGDHAPHRAANHRGQAANSRPGPAGTPRYYLAQIPNGTALRGHAAVMDTATGATLATVWPPKPFSTFVAITGASDDRTFVLAAERGASGPVTLFRARYEPSRRRVTLTALPIPAIPGDERFNGLALSPSGSMVAVSTTVSRPRRFEKLSVYSVTSGAVKVWRQPSAAPAYTLSWDRGGMLAYNWDDSPHHGVWLLNTATAGGGLIADSRLAVAVPHGWAFIWGALLTPDGRTVVAAQMRMSGSLRGHRTNFEFAEFSTATGRQTRALLPLHDGPEELIWTSPAGTVLVVQTRSGQGLGLYVLSGGRLTPIPNPSAAGPFPQFTSLSMVF